MDETTQQQAEDQLAPSYGLLYITRAYNRGEISFDEWLRLSKDWAERIIRQAAAREQRRVDVKTSGRRADEVC